MEEYIDRLRSYLPLNCDYNQDDESDDNEYQSYVQYLRNAFVENTNNEKYQFGLLAFHMMFMSFVYRQFWWLKEHDYEKVRKLCEANARFGKIVKTFDVSEIPEKDVINQTMNILKFHANRRTDVQHFVDTRDNCAHACGFIQYNEDKVETHFNDVLEYVEQIHNKTKVSVKNEYIKDLHEYWDSESYSNYLSVEQATRMIKTMGLSPADILFLLSLDMDTVLGERSELTYFISYFIVRVVFKAYLVEQSFLTSIEYDCSDEIEQLKQYLLHLSSTDYKAIEIELEDEIVTTNQFYNLTFNDDFIEEINHLRSEINPTNS